MTTDDPFGRLERARDALRREGAPEPLRLGLLWESTRPLSLEGLRLEAEWPLGELPGLAGDGDGGEPPLAPPGHLQIGRAGGALLGIVRGRAYRWEGVPWRAVADPIRLLRLLGAEVLVLTEGCDAIDDALPIGSPVAVDDHVNLTGESPLVGPNASAFGPRFPDMSQAYDEELGGVAGEVAGEARIPLFRGVYAGVGGPQPSTPAECRMLRRIGADIVGNAIVPEVLVARHAGMRVLALPVVTGRCGAPRRDQDEEGAELDRTGAGGPLHDLLGVLLRRILGGLVPPADPPSRARAPEGRIPPNPTPAPA